MITKEVLVKVMPKNIKGKITDEFMNTLNGITGDDVVRESFRDNLLGYTSVMKDGKYKIESYVDAVKYVTYKLLGSSNVDAYTKTFPHRFQKLVNNGADDKTISSYVSAYNKNQLVNKIMEQTLVPMHVLNIDLYQKAINTQAELMMYANSEKVRSDSANSLLTHLKPTEVTKIAIDVKHGTDNVIDDLRASTMALAKQQQEMIEMNLVTVKEVAHSKLVQGEVIDA